jgi:hypothetical protein
MKFPRLSVLVCVTLTSLLITCIRATSIYNSALHDISYYVVKRAVVDPMNISEDGPEKFRYAEKELPKATSIEELDPNSPEVMDLRWHSRLCHTVNCRQSLNNWDCENCAELLPDGEVLVYFNTAPHGIVGQIIRSKA